MTNKIKIGSLVSKASLNKLFGALWLGVVCGLVATLAAFVLNIAGVIGSTNEGLVFSLGAFVAGAAIGAFIDVPRVIYKLRYLEIGDGIEALVDLKDSEVASIIQESTSSEEASERVAQLYRERRDLALGSLED